MTISNIFIEYCVSFIFDLVLTLLAKLSKKENFIIPILFQIQTEYFWERPLLCLHCISLIKVYITSFTKCRC